MARWEGWSLLGAFRDWLSLGLCMLACALSAYPHRAASQCGGSHICCWCMLPSAFSNYLTTLQTSNLVKSAAAGGVLVLQHEAASASVEIFESYSSLQ